jgi:predicted PurR-regulated permease PerM
VGRIDRARASLRKAYQSSRSSVQAARAEARALEEAPAPSTAPPGRPVAVPTHSVSSRDDADVPRGLRLAAAWSWRLIVIALALAIVLWLIGRLQVVVVPLVIALLLSALLSPAVGWLRRRGVPRSLATTLVVVGGIAAVAGTLTLVINEFVNGWPQLSEKFNLALAKVEEWLKTGPFNLSEQQINSAITAAETWLRNNQETITSGALATATTVGHIVAAFFLVLFATFFFLRDGRRISRFLFGVLPYEAREPFAQASEASWFTLVSYVRATVLVAFIDALGIGLALVILRIDFALPLAALVFLGAFIPIVGATLSGAVAVLVALMANGPVKALIVLLVVILVQQVEGHLLQPLIMGRAVAIHPLAVIVAIATGVVLSGIIGALVAVPIVAVLNTGIRHLAAVRRTQASNEPLPEPEETPPTGPPAPA